MLPTLTLFAAGSLRRAFLPLSERFTAQTGIVVNVQFGPAGLLRERIEAGDVCDVFASANAQHPQTLVEHGLARESQIFARNTLILTAHRRCQGDALTLLRDPALRLATSTPGCDPSGDYTWQLFDNLDALEPGLGEQLKVRARQLVGGRDSLVIPPGEIAGGWLIHQDLTDLFIGYAHYAAALTHDKSLRVVTLPQAQSLRCEYHIARIAQSENAQKLYAFILAEEGQRCLRDAGFLAVN
ncbi:molybdate ABC transporter substrate-binding protein [Pseudocitrobacter cyperus]|uniref:Molybdate ABC transporter substrate-binding protein n=1 Tax=Pseudocitrobacter cyperus TaxID=3112843 RepID=A0ABV0HG49_9ENTR